MVSSVIASYGNDASGVKDCYYIIIFAAGMWYRQSGALITGLVSTAAFVFAYAYGTGNALSLTASVGILYDSGAVFMPAAGFIVSVLFMAYDRELRRLAEIDHEIDLARRLQDHLLPDTAPCLAGWEIAGTMKRARKVGGDFYAFHLFGDGSIMLVLADMAGKSVHGLVHLSLLHSELTTAAAKTQDLASVAREANARVYPELHPDSYAAVVLLRIWPDADEVEYVNCGHLPPLLLRPDGSLTELATGDPIIGVKVDHEYRAGRVCVPPGAVLICYTDGLVEIRNSAGEMLGEQRMRDFLGELTNLPADAACRELLRHINEFSSEPPLDDQTVVVLRRLQPPGHATGGEPPVDL